MTTEEIAARYNRLPGFRLVSYHNVALPFWIATFDSLVIAEKNIPVVDEFILRAVERGVATTPDLSGFLGLSEKLVTRRLGRLLTDDFVSVSPSSEGKPAGISLTRKGEQALKEVARTKPRRERIAIPYDGISRRPILCKLERGAVLRPQHIKQYGLLEIPALPTNRPPSDEELDKIDFNRAVPKELRRDLSIHQILSARKIGSLDRRAREAVMLVYCGTTDEDQVTVRFFSLDARPLPEVDRGFRDHGGLKKLDLQTKLREHRESLQRELAADPEFQLLVEFANGVRQSPEAAAGLAEGAKLKSTIADKEAALKQTSKDATAEPLEIERQRKEIADLKEALLAAEKRALEVRSRALEPHEHVPIFSRALNEAKSRLMIISPWIKDRLMESHWVKIENLLRRKVSVYIGFGMPERRGDEPNERADNGERTLDFLQRMAATYPRHMHLVKFGDTHAKVLVKDSDTLVAGSFNWMSFGGFDTTSSGKRVIREEISIYVSDPAEVEKMFQRYLKRFAAFDRSLGGPQK